MKRVVIFLSCLIILLSGCSQAVDDNGNLIDIKINHVTLKVERADTPETRAQGLSGRQSLLPNQGMLFVFDSYFKPAFWMKDMLFPIDIIWIKDDQIVDITKNIAPPQSGESLKHYFPNQEINYVLEVNAGWYDDNDIEIGDRILGL